MGQTKYIALLAAGAFACSGSSFYSIGPDAGSIPRNLTAFNSSGPLSIKTSAALGDGTIGLNGGLVYRASDQRLYAIGNDSNGAGALYSFDTFGAGFSPVLPLTVGPLWNGGLAFDPIANLFYAIAAGATPTLYSIDPLTGTVTPLFSVGSASDGFVGGLAFDSADGYLYALSVDGNTGLWSLNRIDRGTQPSRLLLPIRYPAVDSPPTPAGLPTMRISTCSTPSPTTLWWPAVSSRSRFPPAR